MGGMSEVRINVAEIKSEREKSRAAGQQAIVRCQDFRCLAFRDQEGRWRDAFSGKELPPVLEVLERF
jgi:hypothetical protein